jgi:hypothetical protein
MFLRTSHYLFRLAFCLTLCLALAADAQAAGTTTPEGAPGGAPGGGRYRLTLRLRYPDGRPASGAVVSLRQMPDRDVVGWRFADNACQSDERGECHWSVWSGLYEFDFAGALQPDGLTLAAAGSQGLHGLGVYLDRNFTVGLVLADPLTGGAGETLFFDQSPEAELPSYRIPGWEDLHHHEDAAAGDGAEQREATLTVPASEPVAAETGVPVVAATTAPARRGLSWPLLLTAVLLAGGGFFFFYRSRAAASLDAPVDAPPHSGAPAETETES